jgi:aarF domain-containing kinase
MLFVKVILLASGLKFLQDVWQSTPFLGLASQQLLDQSQSWHQNIMEGLPIAILQSIPIRNLRFWSRAVHIYSSYKLHSAIEATRLRAKCLLNPSTLLLNDANRALFLEDCQKRTQLLHEVNSERMMDLCLSLRGFYLKTGQFLGTRHDFMPHEYTRKLSRLHDDIPCMNATIARQILESELGVGSAEDYFLELDLNTPVGSASIAQVHRGVWKDSGETVAVKIQNNEAENLMTNDLINLQRLAIFLQKTDLPFDLLSAVTELQSQIALEFDFRVEATNMDSMGSVLKKTIPLLRVPKSVFKTKRLLVMTYLNGTNLTKLKDSPVGFNGRSGWRLPFTLREVSESLLRKRFSKKLLKAIANIWAEQIFVLHKFHADPHPGNMCIDEQGQLGLFDWGQVKEISSQVASSFAEVIVAISDNDDDRIYRSFLNLGVQVQYPNDRPGVVILARTMFDTRSIPGISTDPFSSDSVLKRNSVVSLPRSVFFLLRTVQMIRGLVSGMGIHDFSLATHWASHAQNTIIAAQ